MYLKQQLNLLEMKSLTVILFISLSFFKTAAQEVNSQFIKGIWEYKSANGKSKLSYKFDVDNKFTNTNERSEKEEQTIGSYELDKKGDIDRLKLIATSKEDGTRTNILYHFIEFSGPDTLKLQLVNDRQTNWLKETKKNTKIFIRKTEKPKE